MKAKTKPLLLISILILALALMASFFWGPLVVVLSRPIEASEGAELAPLSNPLSSFDFGTGAWVAYLALSSDDLAELPDDMSKHRCLKTTDSAVLNQLRDSWGDLKRGGDVATVTSAFMLFRDGKLVFQSGIVLNAHMSGLQSQATGWLEADNVHRFAAPFARFQRVRWPIVFL